MTDKIKNFGGFRVIDGTSASFHLSWLNDETVIYFVRTDAGKEDGFIYFNGKKYGTGKLSSDKIQKQLTELIQTSSNALTSVSGSTSINVTAKASGSQTISVKAKHLSEIEKVAGQIEIITTGTTGIYGLLYFCGDDVEDDIASEM